MKTITITLLGKDNTVHATGEIDQTKIMTASMVVRNGRFYTFEKSRIQSATFIECEQPYTIAEF